MRTSGTCVFSSKIMQILGLLMSVRGDLDDAESMHRQALGINEKLGQREGMANQYGNLGLVMRDRGDIEGAREMWTKARDLFEQVGAKPMVDKVQGWIDDLPS